MTDVETPTTTYVDEVGREFPYVLVTHPGATSLGIHFSAFFGDWGDRKEHEAVFKGYFHRRRMLGSSTEHNWLFICDTYGADRNGTYYSGEHGDLFVDRAVERIIADSLAATGVPPDRCVTLGSSMGATGALVFGLRFGVRGIVAVSPHIDLDICAATQGRERHVAYICPDGDPYSVANHRYTRRIRSAVAAYEPAALMPALFLQACEDDAGVFDEQVMPLVQQWQAAGGDVVLDRHRHGGHTSDYATRPLLLDVMQRLLNREPIDVRRYAQRPYRPARRRTLQALKSQLRAVLSRRN